MGAAILLGCCRDNQSENADTAEDAKKQTDIILLFGTLHKSRLHSCLSHWGTWLAKPFVAGTEMDRFYMCFQSLYVSEMSTSHYQCGAHSGQHPSCEWPVLVVQVEVEGVWLSQDQQDPLSNPNAEEPEHAV